MFSRALPRATLEAGCLAPCRAYPRAQTFARVHARTWRPAQQLFGRRYRSSIREQLKEQRQRSPILFPFAVGVIVVVSAICVFYIPWYYKNVIVRPYHSFPEPVAKKLRRALFYSRGKYLDIKEANKHFRQALQTAAELGMDPFSDEIMGVKYTIAQLFEEAGYYSLACDVLEIMRSDCQRWVDEFSDKHWNDGNRSRVKKNMVQINVKLAQLYDTRYVNEPVNAEKRLVEAVESALSEQARRATEGVKPGEGDWLSDEEMGGTLEALAQHYEQRDSHYLATPLFLQALSMCPPKSCHQVIIMNNISTCVAQQAPPPPSPSKLYSKNNLPSTTPPPPPPSRAELVAQARRWATQALATAAKIRQPDRNEECDIGCAVATHNLGEFYEMEGRIEEAKQKYMEADSLARSAGFADGQVNARAGLKRLKELKNNQKE